MLRDNGQIITGNRKWVGWERAPGRKVGEKKGSSGPELSQVEDKMGEKVGEMLGREPKGELWLARAVVAPISWMS